MTTHLHPIASLKQDNQLMERFLWALDPWLATIKQGAPMNAEATRLAIDFIRVFVEQRHRTKEEKALFPVLAAKSEILANGTVKILADEFKTDRDLLVDLEDSLLGIEAGDPAAVADAVEAFGVYSFMLHNHVEKEDEIIFRLADALITVEEDEALEKQFDVIDREMGPIVEPIYQHVVGQFEELVGVKA